MKQPGRPRRPRRRIGTCDHLDDDRLLYPEPNSGAALFERGESDDTLVERPHRGQIGYVQPDGAERARGIDRHAAKLLPGRRPVVSGWPWATVRRGRAAPEQAASS